MNLRSNCTSQQRSTRRARRLALALALAGSTWTSLSVMAADPSAAELPAMPQYPSIPAVTPECGMLPRLASESRATMGLAVSQPAGSGLLPYPFASDHQSQLSGNLNKVVALIGLHPSRPIQPMPLIRLESSSQVVAASGTTQPTSEAQAKATPPALPALPAPLIAAFPKTTVHGVSKPIELPATQNEPSKSTAQLPLATTISAAPERLTESLSESLLDIEIPSDLMLSATGESVSTAAESTESMGSAKLSSAAVVKACQPPELAASQDASTAATTRLAADRQPEIVRADRPMSLSLNDTTSSSAAIGQSVGAAPVSMSLSDDSTGAPARHGTSQRDGSLHLSSASASPRTTAAKLSDGPVGIPALPRLALPSTSPAMQVRIEGEPAPLIAARAAQRESQATKPVAPRPTMEASVAASPTDARSPLPQPTPKRSVKAMFASRTSLLPTLDDVPVEPTMSAPAASGMHTGESLSVGLQESLALSTDYTIAEMSVEHPTICQLLKTSDQGVSLIGMRPGTTRIALISFDGQGDRVVEVREVSVGRSTPAQVNLPELAKELSMAVDKMVPHSDVQIVAYKDYLLVHGFTNYESDAKQILSLVRKSSLVPVVDRLQSNGN